MRRLLPAAVVLLAGACTCDRGPGLSGRWGELVVVVPAAPEPSLETAAVLHAPAVVMGAEGRSPVKLRNIGEAPLVVLGLEKQGGSDALVLPEVPQATLGPGEELVAEVTFSPPQDADATLATVEHRALWVVHVDGARPETPEVTVEVVADALAADCLVPATFDFGLVPLGERIAVPFPLTNTSQALAMVTLGALAGDDPAFFSVEGAVQALAAPGETSTFTLAFQPSAALTYQATLEVRRADTCPLGLMKLTGVGSDESLTWTPTVLDFGRVPRRETAQKALTFVNQSAAPVTLDVLGVEGAVFARLGAGPVTVPARGTAQVTLSCTPVELGPAAGTLTVSLPFDPPRTARIGLTCAGGGPRLRVAPYPALSFGQVPVFGGNPPWTVARRLTVSNVGTSPPPGTTDWNLFLGHGGQLPWVSILPLNGSTLPNEFSVQVPATYEPQVGLPAIAAQNSVDLEVRLTPLAVGAKEAELRVYSTDAVEPTVVVRLSAVAARPSPCALELGPNGLQFGDLPTGVTATQSIVVRNTAAPPAVCTLSGVELSTGTDPAFRLGAPTDVTLAAGQRVVLPVSLAFAPNTPVGTAAAGYLRFSTSDASKPLVALPLAGRVAECLTVVPSEVDFGVIRTGCRSETKAVNLYNACSVPVSLDALSPPAAPFTVTASPATPVVMPPGAAPVTVQLRFAPTALSDFDDALVLDDTEGASQRVVQVKLHGEGDALGRQTETFTIGKSTADILFTIDDSCSMADEQQSLAANFQAFMAQTAGTQVDYHLAVVTTDDSAGGGQGRMVRTQDNPAVLTRSTPGVAQRWADKVSVGVYGSGWEQPYSTTLKALTPPLSLNDNQAFLRDDASLAVVVVSDANDQSPQPVTYYLTRLLDVKGTSRAWLFSFNVIGPFGSGTITPCAYDGPPDTGRYEALVRGTGGVSTDICTSNWAADLQRIGTNALGGRTFFPLAGTPDTSHAIVVRSNGASISGWTYDPVSNAIRFTGNSLPAPNSTLTVEYTRPCL